jgi:NadR type nicotinamide-nucleotide adenylyltransferase
MEKESTNKPPVHRLKRIVVIGPESTGKSTLCASLALHYDTVWCPEFAREYLLRYGMEYQYEDLLTIARGQLAMEDEYAIMAQQQWETQRPKKSSEPLLFVDTDMYVMKVWSEFVFNRCDPWILKQIVERSYNLYLLCYTDLPWVKDELREYPDLKTRETLFHIYQDILINQSVPWAAVRGTDEERFHSAVDAVDGLLFPKQEG